MARRGKDSKIFEEELESPDGEYQDISLEVELEWYKEDQGVSHDITGIKIAKPFSFKGKNYRKNQDFPEELDKYLLRTKGKDLTDYFRDKFVKGSVLAKDEGTPSPANEALKMLSDSIALLHEAIQEKMQKAPDSLKKVASEALEAMKKLMIELLDHLKGASIPTVQSAINKLEVCGEFDLAQKLRVIADSPFLREYLLKAYYVYGDQYSDDEYGFFIYKDGSNFKARGARSEFFKGAPIGPRWEKREYKIEFDETVKSADVAIKKYLKFMPQYDKKKIFFYTGDGKRLRNEKSFFSAIRKILK